VQVEFSLTFTGISLPASPGTIIVIVVAFLAIVEGIAPTVGPGEYVF